MRILITGGAGFIGSALAHELLRDAAAEVWAFDSLLDQVHSGGSLIATFPKKAKLIKGDVCNREMMNYVVSDIRPDYVVHFAAETGTSQSMTNSARHASVNVTGTAELLDALRCNEVMPKKILLASSRAVYGEGAWKTVDGSVFYPGIRSRAQLAAGKWDFQDGHGQIAKPLAHYAPHVLAAPTSVYGATKLAQENLVKAWCEANDVNYNILRFQNVYGIGQSPTNPYTGIINIFHKIAHAGGVIPVYEDGNIGRDFVWISDVVDACLAAMLLGAEAGNKTYDIGTGSPVTVLDAARLVAKYHGAPEPKITGQFREGDIRWAVADPQDSVADLKVKAKVTFSEGVEAVGQWLFSDISAI